MAENVLEQMSKGLRGSYLILMASVGAFSHVASTPRTCSAILGPGFSSSSLREHKGTETSAYRRMRRAEYAPIPFPGGLCACVQGCARV